MLPSDTHAPSLVPGIACFLPIHDLARSLSSLLFLIRLTRPVVYLSRLCLTILTTVRSLSGRTAVWLNPTHPLRQMSGCLHTLKVTGVCTWDFRDEAPPVWYNLLPWPQKVRERGGRGEAAGARVVRLLFAEASPMVTSRRMVAARGFFNKIKRSKRT